MLNTACRARSEVGRVSRPSCETSLTPLWLPASIRIGLAHGLQLSLDPIFRRLDAELVLQHLALHFLDLALLEIAELEGPVRKPDEAADRPAEMAAELADLAV